MTPFELLSYYANTAALEGALPEDEKSSLPHYLMFMVGDKGFLLDIEKVDSVFREPPSIKPLPFAPGWYKGLCSVRNEIVSVISFAMLVDANNKPSKRKDEHYILLNGALSGFLLEVDKLMGIRALNVEKTELGHRFIDAEVVVDDLSWQRVDLSALPIAKLNKEMDFK